MPAELVDGRGRAGRRRLRRLGGRRAGKDPGALADAGGAKAEGTAKAKGGKLEIPAVRRRARLQVRRRRGARRRARDRVVKNEPDDHNIAIEGNGVNEKGEIVKNGGMSKVEVDLKPGEYAFFCSVPGHREGGMEGKLTVK